MQPERGHSDKIIKNFTDVLNSQGHDERRELFAAMKSSQKRQNVDNKYDLGQYLADTASPGNN